MGCKASTPKENTERGSGFHAIEDRFRTIEEVQADLRKNGLESSELIIGVDFTKSNSWNGKHSFGGKNLHDISPSTLNPYEHTMMILGRTLQDFDDDNLIPAYGFGDITTHDTDVFAFNAGDSPCHGLDEVLARYRDNALVVNMSGPTTFGPLIRRAIDIVVEHGCTYHILVIIADGQVTRSVDTPRGTRSQHEQDTVDAIVEASKYPLSIIMVGVGDGPWDTMVEFDDMVLNADRKFDNFQYVNFNKVMSHPAHNRDAYFALNALMEIPDQFKSIVRLRLLGRSSKRNRRKGPTPLEPPAGAGSSSDGDGRRRQRGASGGKERAKVKAKVKGKAKPGGKRDDKRAGSSESTSDPPEYAQVARSDSDTSS